MYPVINIFGRDIGTYSLLFIVGLAVSVIGAIFVTKKKNIMYEDIILAFVSVGVGILVGGHLLYGITQMANAVKFISVIDKLSIKTIGYLLVLTFGGSVFYGGFIGAVAALFIHTKFSKDLKRSDIFDIFAIFIPLFHAFGRVGCFFGGCCYGIESRFGFTVMGNSLVPELNGVSRFPVQLFEAALNLCIFAILLYLFLKTSVNGNLIFVYMFLYPIVRFCMEFLRGDAIRGRVLWLSTSQWISLGLFTISVVYFVQKFRKKKSV